MRFESPVLDLVIKAVEKLDRSGGERENLFAFIQSCYCGRVRDYDLDFSLQSLARLTDEEQHALIAWVVASDEAPATRRLGRKKRWKFRDFGEPQAKKQRLD